MFRRLADMPWADDARARAAGYHLRALTFHPAPENILCFTLETMELFEFERTRIARDALATSLDKVLAKYQRKYPAEPLAALYQSLIKTADRTSYVRTLGLVGLNTALRERKPSSQAFFDWVAHKLACGSSRTFADIKNMAYLLPVVMGLNELARRHPVLVARDYAGTCCALLNIPYRTPPVVRPHEQPHQKSERVALSQDIKEDNRVIQSIYAHALRGIDFVVKAQKKHIIKKEIHELFSDQSLKILEEAASRQRMAKIAGTTIPATLNGIYLLIAGKHAQSRPKKHAPIPAWKLHK